MTDIPLVILCAGESRRLGKPKGLWPVLGQPWLEIQVERCAAIGIAAINVVLGHHLADYLTQLPWLQDASRGIVRHGVKLIATHNQQPQHGMFSSIQCGLRTFEDRPAVLLMPIDTPCPTAAVWQALRASPPTAQAAIPRYSGHGGHPVLLRQPLIQNILAMQATDPQARLDYRLHTLDKTQLHYVDVDDPLVTTNLNTAEDFATLVV